MVASFQYTTSSLHNGRKAVGPASKRNRMIVRTSATGAMAARAHTHTAGRELDSAN
jgi:hypothetical protein